MEIKDRMEGVAYNLGRWIHKERADLVVIVIIAFIFTSGCMGSDKKNFDATQKSTITPEQLTPVTMISHQNLTNPDSTKEFHNQTIVAIPSTTDPIPVVRIDSKGDPDWIQKQFVYTPEGWNVVGSCNSGGCWAQIQARDEFSFIQVFQDKNVNYDTVLKINQSPVKRSQATGTYAILNATRDDTQYIINGIGARHAVFKIENDVTLEHTNGDFYLFDDGTIMIYYHRLSADPRDIANSRKIMETYRGLN